MSANYYPITSAIAVRDFSKQKKGLKNAPQRQVVIVNDRSQGASAGLRGNRNIEIMQNRRFKLPDNYGVVQPLNDLDEWGKGIQVQASYYMQITDLNNKDNWSDQRSKQLSIDQPFLLYYSHDFKILDHPHYNSTRFNVSRNSS